MTVPSAAQSFTRAVRSETRDRCTNSWNLWYRAPVIGTSRSLGLIAVRTRPDARPTAPATRASTASDRILSARAIARTTATTAITTKLTAENRNSRFSLKRLIVVAAQVSDVPTEGSTGWSPPRGRLSGRDRRPGEFLCRRLVGDYVSMPARPVNAGGEAVATRRIVFAGGRR